MSDLFDLYLTGRCVGQQQATDVAERLAQLFKTSPDRFQSLLEGKPQLLKRGLDRAAAQRYKQALFESGAMVAVKQHSADAPAAGTPSAPSTPTKAVAESAPATWQLSATGSDLLRPEERPAPAVVQVRTEHLHTEPVGERLAPVQPPVERTIPTDHLQLGALGEPLEPPSNTPSALPAIDTRYLDLAPPGSDVLSDEERQRQRPTPVTVDVDHLSL